MAVEKTHYENEELDYEARQLVKDIHRVRRAVAAAALDVRYLLVQILAQGIERGAFLSVNKSRALFGDVAELLFYDEWRRQLIALIHILVHNEAVELRTQNDNLQNSGDDDVEQGEFEHGIFRVSFFDVLIDIRQVDALGYERLVVAAVGIQHGHYKVHAVDIS